MHEFAVCTALFMISFTAILTVSLRVRGGIVETIFLKIVFVLYYYSCHIKRTISLLYQCSHFYAPFAEDATMILCQSAFCLNTDEDYDSKNISYLFLSVMSAGVAFKERHTSNEFLWRWWQNLPTRHNKGRTICSVPVHRQKFRGTLYE